MSPFVPFVTPFNIYYIYHYQHFDNDRWFLFYLFCPNCVPFKI